jgi:predicted amidohydrolase YtcJ
MSTLAELGITSVQDNTWFAPTVTELAALHRNGGQTVRVSCWSLGAFPPMDFWLSHKRYLSDWYMLGPRKHFVDGSFSARTAWLLEPYSDDPGSTGGGRSADEIEPWLRRAARQGRQVACHCIGDAATGAYCDAVEHFSGTRGNGDRTRKLRHRIEHGQLIAQDDVERIVRLGMVVSAQPHAAADPEKDERLLGPSRACRAYAYRDLLDAGVSLAFGSDFPGEYTLDPMFGIHLAVNRAGGQAITPEEAISCYTLGSATAEFAESKKGRIAEGYLADMAILSADPTKVDPKGIKDIQVDATIVDGRVVFLRPGMSIDDGIARHTGSRRS